MPGSTSSDQLDGQDVPAADGPITARVVIGVVLVIVAAELAAMSALMVATALPRLAENFGRADVSWTFTSSALFAAAVVALVGKAADMYGKRLVLVALIALTAIGSVVAALAPNYEIFIVGRALQGACYVLPAVAFSLIRDVFPRRAVMVAVSVVFTGGGVFIVLAPFAAGWLTDGFGVLSIFWSTAIIAAGAGIGICICVPESPIRVPTRLNWVGAALLGGGTGVVIYSVGQGQVWGWGSGTFLSMIALGIGCFALWIAWDSKFSHPLIDFSLLRAPRMVWALVATVCVYALFNPLVSVIPSMLQTPGGVGGDYGLGLTSNGVALAQIPFAILLVASGAFIGFRSGSWGVKAPFVFGMAVLAVTIFAFSFVPSSMALVLPLFGALGLGFGLVFAALPNLLMQAAPMDRQGIASVMQNVVANIGSGTALQVVFTLLAAHVVIADDGGYYYDGSAFATVYRALAVVAIIGVVVGVLLPLGRKSDVLAADAGEAAAEMVADELEDQGTVTAK